MTVMKLLIVEDEPLMKSALTLGLESLGFEVAATTGSAHEVIALAELHRPDVVLLDLDLGDGPTGVDISCGLRAKFADIGLVILSSYASPRLIGRFLPELPEGAIFLQKRSVSELAILASAIRDAGRYPAKKSRTKSSGYKTSISEIGLTDLEIQLMSFISMGFTNAVIAKRRFITEKSTENAIRLLTQKIQLNHNVDLHNQRIMLTRKYLSLIGKL